MASAPTICGRSLARNTYETVAASYSFLVHANWLARLLAGSIGSFSDTIFAKPVSYANCFMQLSGAWFELPLGSRRTIAYKAGTAR